MRQYISLPVLAVVLLGVIACCGCANYQSLRTSSLSGMDANNPGEPVSFSDEISRDLVRQTRELLVLKNQDYLVGPDDVLEISIFEWEMSEETKALEFRVSESGVISLPSLGIVHVAGKTVQEIHKTIETQLSARNILQNPRVGVAVKEYRSRRIAVIGEVEAPGVYAIHQNVSTLMDILTLAGGPSASAGEIAYVLRSEKEDAESLRIIVDMEDLFDKGNFQLNAVLQGGDIVYVPKAPLVYVYGHVKYPGGFSLHRSLRVLEAIALAGGFSSEADKRNCLLARRSKQGEDIIVELNIARIEKGKLPNIFLREGDVLRVPRSPGLSVLSEIWSIFRGIFTFTYRLDSND